VSNRSYPVLMIGWEYPPHNSGGLGVACQGLTTALAGQNTEIFFTLPHPNVGPIDHMSVLDCSNPAWFDDSHPSIRPPFSSYSTGVTGAIDPIKIGKAVFDRHELQVLPESQLEAQVEEYADLVHEKAREMKDSFEVIHAHDWMSFPAAMRVAETTKKPFIAHVHSTEFDRIPGGQGSSYIKQTEYEGMMRADRIIAVSFYTKQVLVHTYGIDSAKIDVVHNGIAPLLHPPNTGRHLFAPKRPVIVFMGRLTMQKGADHFIALAHSVLAELPSALFVVAGDGDMYHQLLFETAYRGVSAHVLFSGFLRDKQRETLLDRADVFVMPSLSEPFGLVALEAAQRNTPVIVSTNSGVREVMPNSVSADFWDIEKMTQEIVRSITQPEHRERVVQGQLHDVAALTWDTAAQKVKDVYSRAFLGRNR